MFSFPAGRCLLWLLVLVMAKPVQANEDIRRRFEAQVSGHPLRVGDERLLAMDALRSFYEQRQYELAWSDGGDLVRQANQLLQQIEAVEHEGLQPRDYFLTTLRGLIDNLSDGIYESARVDLDLLLSDAFLLLGSHLALGKVNPETIDPEWLANRRELDMVPLLQRALTTSDIATELNHLRPQNPGYERLRQARLRWADLVERYRDWPLIESGPLIKPGMEDARIPSIRIRMQQLGLLPAHADGDNSYDPGLRAAIEQFQAQEGLGTDGVIGAATLGAMNLTPAQRLQRIDLNLERWRWLPRELGRTHVLVNVAAFELQLIEDGRNILQKRVVVGRDYRRTPVMSDRIRYLVFNPTWTVPQTLAVKDKLPEIRKDPTYLSRLGFTLYEGWGENRTIVDPARVDWARLPANRFPYQLVQGPGPQNALGQVKFMFPNKFDVYLHDSPARELFRQSQRAFSSGCVRVEEPLDLAEALLRNTAGWDRARIEATVAAGQTLTVHLAKPVPVHLQYWTAWVDGDGREQFRNDLYDRDPPLARALAAESVEPLLIPSQPNQAAPKSAP